MTLALLAAIVAALAALARGGSLEHLAATRFSSVPLLIAALLVQVGFRLWEPAWLTPGWQLAVTVGSMGVVAIFLALNRSHPGMLIAGIGLALNVVVIAANGAMPVSPEAARTAGLDPAELDEAGLKHERMTSETSLPWLGDVIPLPRSGLVVSGGDLLLALGFAALTYRRTLKPPPRPRNRLEEEEEEEGTRAGSTGGG